MTGVFITIIVSGFFIVYFEVLTKIKNVADICFAFISNSLHCKHISLLLAGDTTVHVLTVCPVNIWICT